MPGGGETISYEGEDMRLISIGSSLIFHFLALCSPRGMRRGEGKVEDELADHYLGSPAVRWLRSPELLASGVLTIKRVVDNLPK
jgi:hypothetical protein